MKKTFKSSSVCNISNFHNVFFLNLLKVQRSLFERIARFLNHVTQKHSSKQVKSAFAVYLCIKLSLSYFILRSYNFWRKCPCTLKFGTHALKEMFLKTVCTFFMKLFLSKDNFLLAKLFINQNWSNSIKFIITKTICFLKKRAHIFSKVIIRNMYFLL